MALPPRTSREHAADLSEAHLSERRLMAAVMWNAFHPLQRIGASPKPLEQESIDSALRWFRDEDSEYLFSFRSICAHLGIEPSVVLERVDELITTQPVEGATCSHQRDSETHA